MPDFRDLLKKPAGEAKKPPALRAGNYPGVVKSFEYGDNNKNKTPYVRFQLGATGPAETVEPSEYDGIDLSKKQFRKDFYLTDDAWWRLDAFLRSVGIEPKGRTYEECIPEVVGCDVLIEVQQEMNQTTNEIFNKTEAVKGTHQVPTT